MMFSLDLVIKLYPILPKAPNNSRSPDEFLKLDARHIMFLLVIHTLLIKNQLRLKKI